MGQTYHLADAPVAATPAGPRPRRSHSAGGAPPAGSSSSGEACQLLARLVRKGLCTSPPCRIPLGRSCDEGEVFTRQGLPDPVVSDLLSRTEWRATRSPTCSWSDRGRASDRARRLRVREPGLPSPAGRRHRPRHLQGPAANTSLHGATDLKSGMGCTVTLSLASRMRSSFAMVVVENARGLKRRAASTPRMIPVFMSSAP